MPRRVATIGIDGHLNYVTRAIPKLSDCHLVAVAKGREKDNLRKVRNAPSFTSETRLYDDYRRMLDEVRPDVVAICMPFYRNAEACIEAAKRHCHIMCEKPIATTLDDLERIRRAVAEAGVRITCMWNYRLFPAISAARDAVRAGKIGEPILASARKSYEFNGPRPDFYRRRETYGGTIPWVAIHAIDYVRWVTGLEYTRVAAFHANKAHPNFPGCEDSGAILYGLSNQGQATITFDYLRPDGAPTHGDDWLRVAGSEGVLEVVDDAKRCLLLRGPNPPEELALPKTPDLFENFMLELRGGAPHVISAADVFRVTEVALKTRNAADTGTLVDL